MHPLASLNASRPTSLQDVPQTSPPSPTILIVEDDPGIASALTRLLTRDGYQAEVVHNGQEALTACQQQAYMLILCDLWMPVLDGQGFYEALHRCQPQLCARVVFLTGDTLTPTVQTFLVGTPVPLLTKPFTAEQLRALLRERCPSPQPVGETLTAGDVGVACAIEDPLADYGKKRVRHRDEGAETACTCRRVVTAPLPGRTVHAR